MTFQTLAVSIAAVAASLFTALPLQAEESLPDTGTLSSIFCPAEGVSKVEINDLTEKALVVIQFEDTAFIRFGLIGDLQNKYVQIVTYCGQTPQVTIAGKGTVTMVIFVPEGVTVMGSN